MNKKLLYVLGGAAVLVIGIIVLGASPSGKLGGGLVNNINPIFTEGLRASLDATQVINSSAQLVSQINTALTSVFSGSFTATGENRITNPKRTGPVTALTGNATSVVTAANVCDSSILTKTNSAASASTTFPTAAAMFADCLTTNGDEVNLTFRNLGVNAASTTILVAAASTTMIGETSTIDGGDEALLKFVRYSDTEMLIFVDEYSAAD